MRCRIATAFLFVLAACTGCAPGLIYTDIVEPVVLDMDRTLSGGERGKSDTKHIALPASGVRVSAEWDSRAIGDAARKAGLKTVHFADMRTVSVLGGVWEQKTIHVYGE